MNNIINNFNKLYNKKNSKKDSHFANILKLIRQSKNYTQNDMAKILDCCGSYLSKIETGQITKPHPKVINNFKLEFKEETKTYNLDNKEEIYEDILNSLYNFSLNINFKDIIKNNIKLPTSYLLKFVYYTYNFEIEKAYNNLNIIFENKILYQDIEEEIFYITIIYFLIINLKFYDSYIILKNINKSKLNNKTIIFLDFFKIIIEYFLFYKKPKLEDISYLEMKFIKHNLNKTINYLNIFKFISLEYDDNYLNFYFNNKNKITNLINIKIFKLIIEKDYKNANELIISNSENNSLFFKLFELIVSINLNHKQNYLFLLKKLNEIKDKSNFIFIQIFSLISKICTTDTILLKNQINSYFDINKLNSIQSILILKEILNISFILLTSLKKYKSFCIIYDLYKEFENKIIK